MSEISDELISAAKGLLQALDDAMQVQLDAMKQSTSRRLEEVADIVRQAADSMQRQDSLRIVNILMSGMTDQSLLNPILSESVWKKAELLRQILMRIEAQSTFTEQQVGLSEDQ